MTTDFGGRRRRRGVPVPALILVALAALAAFFVGDWLIHRPANIQKAQAWAIKGPPCQPLSAQAYQAQAIKVTEHFDDDGVTFGRAGGHVSCEDIVNDGGRGFGSYTECQFTGPGVLQVSTPSGQSYFLPSGPATVTIRKNAVSCVQAAWYRGDVGG
jgi:hypothetical protein